MVWKFIPGTCISPNKFIQQPDAVFIELDLQRLSRAFRDGQKINRPITILFFSGENPDGGGTITLQSAILAPQNLEKRSRGLAHFLRKIALKNPIQDMYEGLEAQGITPGEEVRLSSGWFCQYLACQQEICNIFHAHSSLLPLSRRESILTH